MITFVIYGAVFLYAKILLQKLLETFQIFKRWSKLHIFYDDLLYCYANLEANRLYVFLLKRKMPRMKNVEENTSDVVGHTIFLSVFPFPPPDS